MIRSTDDEPMTLGERYSGAIQSSSLRLKETTGDVDMIIAAGLAEDTLAAGLFRLHVEYDVIRAEHRAAEETMRAREDEARRQTGDVLVGAELVDGKLVGGRLVSAEERAKAITDIAEAAALTEHMLILSYLPSLRSVKEQVARYALAASTRLRYMAPPEYVLTLAGRVLDVHLSPKCRKCNGKGFNGNRAKGEQQKRCRACKGSGSRRDELGKDDADRRFANELLKDFSAMVGNTERRIGQLKSAVREGKDRIHLAQALASR